MELKFPTEEMDTVLDRLNQIQKCRDAVETLLHTETDIATNVLAVYIGKLNILQMLGLFLFAGPVFVLLNIRGRYIYRLLDRG